jgi:hypothetical protein
VAGHGRLQIDQQASDDEFGHVKFPGNGVCWQKTMLLA